MTLESASMYFTGGGSDKEYHAQIVAQGAGYVVNFQYGRRGGTLKSDTKTQTPVDEAAARKIYEKLLKEKQGKGYVPSGTTQAFVTIQKQDSGYHPQLLNPCEKEDAQECIDDDAWVAQEKYDGDRRLMHFQDGVLRSINRKGEFVGLPQETADKMQQTFAGATSYVVDGELIDNIFVAFDLLVWNDEDIRQQSVKQRWERLNTVMQRREGLVQLAEMAVTTAQKQALFDRVKTANGEGVVFKLGDAVYIAGRPNSGGDQLKFKFWKTATFKVGRVNAKRSVSLELMENDAWVDVGNVTIPANADIPKVGELIEVRYLYAYKDGSVYQPTFLRLRDDLEESACQMTQLSYKVDVSKIQSVTTVLQRMLAQIKDEPEGYEEGYSEVFDTPVATMLRNMLENPTVYVDEYVVALEQGLNELAGNDFFGTECQCDPRGDGRNAQWSMSNIEM